MKSNTLKIIFYLIVVTFIACNKEAKTVLPISQPDGLPFETQEGKNTFGCFLNDTLWLPYNSNYVTARFQYDSILSIGAYNVERSEDIEFIIKISKTGYYEMGENGFYKIRISRSLDGFYSEYKILEPKGLNINITKLIKPIAQVKGIISGNFTAKFYKIKSNTINEIDLTDSIVIKKAVFDIELK
ncbi:MAG: hypothetical protein ACOYMA_05215 [Bacteroidia bacterium]